MMVLSQVWAQALRPYGKSNGDERKAIAFPEKRVNLIEEYK